MRPYHRVELPEALLAAGYLCEDQSGYFPTHIGISIADAKIYNLFGWLTASPGGEPQVVIIVAPLGTIH